MRFALALLVVAAACARGHDHRDACEDGEAVHAGTAAYCVITCAGASEDGAFGGTHVDDGVVTELGGTEYTPDAAKLPPEVCAKLPHGCRGTTPACIYARDRDVARQHPRDPEVGSVDPQFAARCRADDPQCGPEPFRKTCLANVFASDHSLVLVDGDHLRERLSAPANCDSDGECIDSGCGYQCLSTRDRSDMAYICIGLPDLDEKLTPAACGCFHHHCAWEKQALHD